MNSIRLVVVSRFFITLMNYFDESSYHLLSSTAHKAVEKASATKIEFEVAFPHVIIPKSAKSASLLEVDLGMISVFNIFTVVISVACHNQS